MPSNCTYRRAMGQEIHHRNIQAVQSAEPAQRKLKPKQPSPLA